jgi:hypothetical protein
MIEVIADPVQLLKVKQALSSLQAENFIRPELEVYGKSVVEVASPYPNQAEGARYVRTGTLGDRWERSVSGLDVRIKNLAPYAGWVLARNPKRRKGALRPGKDRKSMSMDWKFGWKQTAAVMLEQMDEWIVYMEHKAFRLWER